ncbi:hypothetical protein AAFF_G00172090 [Aldrovandia affinis]|uniref:Uncharacterized protein n=1 Tax=Aldrovandia affinis TaxID=143900 RepID=A0AAD7SYV2_9TELE|nr:hypothetical protein AAFF_G00172090 [Aldrovandia affinis]
MESVTSSLQRLWTDGINYKQKGCRALPLQLPDLLKPESPAALAGCVPAGERRGLLPKPVPGHRAQRHLQPCRQHGGPAQHQHPVQPVPHHREREQLRYTPCPAKPRSKGVIDLAEVESVTAGTPFISLYTIHFTTGYLLKQFGLKTKRVYHFRA